MDSSDIATLLETELQRHDCFENLHGVTAENLRSYLVAPNEVTVDPDDLQTPPRPMWLVLAVSDRMIAYDSETHSWAVVEQNADMYVQLVSAESLAGALDSM